MPVFTSSFERGPDSNQWEFHDVSFDTDTPLSGKRSLRLNPEASQQYAITKESFGVGVYVIRLRCRFDVLPDLPSYLVGDGSGGVKFVDGQLYSASASGRGATGAAVEVGTEYIVDLKIDSTVSPWLIDASVNGEPLGQWAQPSPAHTNARQVRIGDLNVRTMDVVVDDFQLSTLAADYPIGF